MKRAMILKSITSIALVASIMIGTTGVISKKADKASTQEAAFYTLTGNSFAASRAQAVVKRTVTFKGAVSKTVSVDSGKTLGQVLSQFGISAPRGYNYTFKNTGGTGINTNYTITRDETITVTKNANSGQVILHNLGSSSGSPRIINVKTGDKLTPYLPMKSDYDQKYLLAVSSSVQYGGKTYFHPKYVPSLIVDSNAARQEFTGIWIGRGQSQTITYTMTRADVQALKNAVEKEIKSLENGQKVNRFVAGTLLTAVTSFVLTPLAGFFVGAASTLVDLGDPSTEAAIQKLKSIKTLCTNALNQSGNKFAMKVRYNYPSNAGYHSCLEVDVDCQIVSFAKA